MKIVMKEIKHLWVVLGEEHLPYNEVIIDLERQDIRARIGANIVKLKFEGDKLKAILVDDVFVYKGESA